jgi:transcriptional regulator with XRE-family HTH domain
MKTVPRTEKAKLLRKIRLNLFLTQEEFAKKLEVCSYTISQYECGRRFPNLGIFKKILELANASGMNYSRDDFDL